MKHAIYVGLILTLLVLAVVCTYIIFETRYVSQEGQTQTYYAVYIDDVQVDYHAMRTSESPHVMLPVLALIESLGGTVSWQSDAVAYVTFLDILWEFNMKSEQVLLRPVGSNSSGILYPPLGSTVGIFSLKVDRDAYIDSLSLQTLLFNYFRIRSVNVDDDQLVIQIYTK